MRKTLTALLLAAALPTLAIAGPGIGDGYGHGAHHMKGDAPHMMRGLDLDREQHRKIRDAQREQMKEHRAIVQRYLDKLPAADKAAMEKELQANRDKQQKAIRDTLTAEQQKRFDELSKEREQRRAERAEFEAWKAEREQKAQ